MLPSNKQTSKAFIVEMDSILYFILLITLEKKERLYVYSCKDARKSMIKRNVRYSVNFASYHIRSYSTSFT